MISFNFQELFMKVLWEGKEFELRGIEGKPCKIINAHDMTKILKKQQRGVIVQLCSLDVQTSKLAVSQDIQKVLDKYSKVFDTTKGLPPTRDHDHAINLIPRSDHAINIMNYWSCPLGLLMHLPLLKV
jgi:hypothetical protein